MRRGFKAEAERWAAQLRDEMNKEADATLDPDESTAHLGIEVPSAEHVVERTTARFQADAGQRQRSEGQRARSSLSSIHCRLQAA